MIIRPLFIALASLSAIFLVQGCAQIVPLSGGEPDRLPPKLISSQPQNNTTGFSGKQVILLFDEYVQLRDLKNQLTISPRLENEPMVNADGKKVVIDLNPQDLLPNTTYRFAFGKAIADMHESNPLEGFEFVFSTGPVIDSLRIEGLVEDALTRRPLKDILVGLYIKDLNSDSLPFHQPADYIARTDESGRFRLQNLPASLYRAYAIDDRNKNALYDGDAEKAGVLSEALNLRSDTVIGFSLFQEDASRYFIRKTVSPFYGFSQLILNRKAQVQVTTLNKNLSALVAETEKGKARDTIPVFYHQISDSLKLLLNWKESGRTDTVQLMLPRNNRNKRIAGSAQLHAPGGFIPFRSKPRLVFPSWMDTTILPAKALLMWKADSTEMRDTVKGRWTDINVFEISNTLLEGTSYIFRSDTGTFFDKHNSTTDSLRLSFRTHTVTDFGKVTVNISLNKKQAYVIQLVDEKLSTVRAHTLSLSLSSSNTTSIVFEDLKPGTYQIRIVYDDNSNGVWDTGNVTKNILPERTQIDSRLIKVVADWEIEEDIVIKTSNEVR